MPSKFWPYWMTPAIVKAAGVMACILFIVSYAVDLTLLSFEVAPSSTVLNDIASHALLPFLHSYAACISSRKGTHESNRGVEPQFAAGPG